MSDYEYKQVIILRKDLNMRKGKMVAQGAHASMAAILNKSYKKLCQEQDFRAGIIMYDPRILHWLDGRFAKICVGVDSEKELTDLYKRAVADGMICSLIQDAGFTEFNGELTYTAVAIGPDLISKVDEYTKDLKLL